MRLLGVFFLGLGITLLIPSGIALGYVRGLTELLVVLVCTIVVPVPLIIGGVAVIRAAEDSALPRTKVPEGGILHERAANPLDRVFVRMRQYDLNRLNWIGWLLLLATFGFVIAEAAVLALCFGDKFKDELIVARLIGLAALLLAIGFFVGVRWLLRLMGVSIHRW
jgi:hypothetical protein